MGRGPNWRPPRHLAAARRTSTDAREHLVAEWLLAAVAIVLTTVVVVGQMVGRPGPPAASDPPAAAGPPAAGPRATTPPAAWLSIGGARVERTVPAAFTASGQGDQGMALAKLARCTPGRIYAATLRVRTSRPGTLVEVTLLEAVDGRRVAEDTIGAMLPDQAWQRVEVAHEAHLPGTALAVEVVLPRGSPRATVLVDDLEVR